MTAVILQITAKAIPPKSHHNTVMGSERSIGHWWVIYIFEDVNNMRLEEMEKLESVWVTKSPRGQALCEGQDACSGVERQYDGSTLGLRSCLAGQRTR